MNEKTGPPPATPLASTGHRIGVNRLGAYVLMLVMAGRQGAA